MDLRTADASAQPRRKNFYLFLFLYFPRDQGTGDNRAKTFHHEDAINRQAKKRFRVTRRDVNRQPRDLLLQLIESGTGSCAHSDNRRTAGI